MSAIDASPPVDVAPDPPKPKKKKKVAANQAKPSAKKEATYAPAKHTTQIEVKPTRRSNAAASSTEGGYTRELARGSSRNLVQAPEGGYATGHYRVLLETKRVEMLCRSLSLQYRHVELLHRLFLSEDDYHTGHVTIDEFFHAIQDEKRPLTLGIFPYAGLDKRIKRLTFDLFVLCIVTFAALSRKELLHYAFTLFDTDASGIMDLNELQSFCGNLQNKSNGFYFQRNVEIAQKKLVERDHTSPGVHRHAAGAGPDGVVDFDDLQEGSEHFQVAFYPLLQFQQNIRAVALGEAFWADVVFRKSQIERIVHYMRLHDGHLPPLSLGTRLKAVAKYAAYMLTGGGRAATMFHGGVYALRKAAITKYAEELRIKEEMEEAAKLEKEKQRELTRREQAADGEGEGEGPGEGGEPPTQVQAFTVDDAQDAHTDKNPPKKKKKKKKTPAVGADG